MSRKVWSLIKQSKGFYIRNYRRLGTMLLLSLIGNILLGLAVADTYLIQKESDFYATYGETPPVLLTARDEPNYSSVPLLAADVVHDSSERAAPQ